MTGSEIYAYNLAKELSKNHEVSIFYRINNRKYKEYEIIKDTYNGLDIYKINNTLKNYLALSNIYYNEDVESRFSEILDKVKPDIAHLHHLLFLSTGIVDKLKKLKIPVIFTLHDYWLICPKGQLIRSNLDICKNPSSNNCLWCLGLSLNIKNLFKRLFNLRIRLNRKSYGPEHIYKNVDLFIAPSRYLRDKFIKFGIPKEKILYADNGINLDLFQDTGKTCSDKVRFGFIGTLIPSKGAHVAIKAFNMLKGDKAILKIYGNPPRNNGIWDYFSRIKAVARGNKNIRFMGVFDNKEIANIFKEMDVLIFPSVWEENSPLVLHEAILTKTPVLASDIGGVSELVKNAGNGFLFSPGNAKELYKHIRNIIENPLVTRNMVFDADVIKSITDNCKEMEEIYAEKINK